MMREGTIIAILTRVDFFGIRSTEFGLVLLRVIEVLHAIMAPDAAVTLGAFFLAREYPIRGVI